MVSVYQSLNKLQRKVDTLVRKDIEEILKRGCPPCFKTKNSCEKVCKFKIECTNIIVLDSQDLKKWGL